MHGKHQHAVSIDGHTLARHAGAGQKGTSYLMSCILFSNSTGSLTSGSRQGDHVCLVCSNLYDVFKAIKEDEDEHVKVMTACRDYSIIEELAKRKLDEGRPAEASPGPTMDRTQLT